MSKLIYSHGKVEGYLRKDSFGRAFIDKCPSDEIHLTSPIDPDYRECRVYLDELLYLEDHLDNNVKLDFNLKIVQLAKN